MGAEGVGTVLVEVGVTHFVDDRKPEQIRRIGIPAIEIDLSVCRDATSAALEVALSTSQLALTDCTTLA